MQAGLSDRVQAWETSKLPAKSLDIAFKYFNNGDRGGMLTRILMIGVIFTIVGCSVEP